MIKLADGHGVVLHRTRPPQFYRDGSTQPLSTSMLHRSLVVRFTVAGRRVSHTAARLLRGVAVVDVPGMELVSRNGTWSMNSLVWMTPGDARKVSRWGQRIADLPHRTVELTPAAALEVAR